MGLSKQEDFHWPENRLKKREKLIAKEEKKIQNSKLMKRKFNRNLRPHNSLRYFPMHLLSWYNYSAFDMWWRYCTNHGTKEKKFL